MTPFRLELDQAQPAEGFVEESREQSEVVEREDGGAGHGEKQDKASGSDQKPGLTLRYLSLRDRRLHR